MKKLEIMKKFILPILVMILLFIAEKNQAQNLTQTIRGQVIDEQATAPLVGAALVIKNSDPVIGTITDEKGYFEIKNVPLGRQTIVVSFIGYEPKVVGNVIVNSGKEVYLDIKLTESVVKMDEIKVIANKKEKPLNDLALISSRSFTVDEALRHAGSWNDPSRMAANFAGVSTSDDTRNDIIVKGNSPNGIIFQLEGIAVPNPNHFGTYGANGGAISMFSQNVLGTSDFLTGAFPAEYGNALSGVFDIKLRKGNSQNYENSFTFGMRGIELSTEGPISRESKASYLVNYRYSTLGLFEALNLDFGFPAVPIYQDLSVKVNFPLKNGYLKVFGLGGVASIDLKDSETELPEDYFTPDQPSDIYSGTRMGVVGVAHKMFFNESTFGELILTASQAFEEYHIDTLAPDDYTQATRHRQGDFAENKLSLRYKFNKKFNAKHKTIIGLQADYLDLDFNETKVFSDENETQFTGTTNLFSGFAQHLLKLNQAFNITAGVHARYYELSDYFSFEPRISTQWKIGDNQSINAGFGVHSQQLPSYAYFIQGVDENGISYNKYANANPMLSQHFIFGYDKMINDNLRFKAEVYYQYLYNIPVESSPTSWSAVNLGGDFGGFPDDLDDLVNEGTGQNYGIELTLERFFNKGYYFLITSSLYKSKYEGSDNIERNTAFNGNYVVNALAGKEFRIGKNKENTFAVNFKLTMMGGKRYIPIDEEQTQLQRSLIYDDENAYTKRQSDYLRADLKLSYNINKSKTTHQISIDIQNITNNQNLFREIYNLQSDKFTQEYQIGFFPEIQYRIMF